MVAHLEKIVVGRADNRVRHPKADGRVSHSKVTRRQLAQAQIIPTCTESMRVRAGNLRWSTCGTIVKTVTRCPKVDEAKHERRTKTKRNVLHFQKRAKCGMHVHTTASNCFAGLQQRTFGTITFTTRLRVSDEKSRASLVHTRAETSVAACEKCFVRKCPRIPFAICLGRGVCERQPSVCVRDPPVGADVGASVPCLRCLSFAAAVALAVVKHAIAVAAAYNIAVRDLNLIVRNELDGTPHPTNTFRWLLCVSKRPFCHPAGC